MSAMDKWKSVWSGKRVETSGASISAALIRANGFDTGGGDYTEAQWRSMVEDLVRRLQIDRHCRVLEVGCGAGALLHEIRALTGAQIHGYDYSASLIAGANRWIEGRFQTSEALHNPFAGERFDVVLSHSVFQYFPDADY
jgi:2-polyprenyl-3-methyl-5-hydroxy-6-metoxy-1,4-benzoquinol methylase